MKRTLTHGWEFVECPLETVEAPEEGWSQVTVPHDWLIFDVNRLYRDSTGFYRLGFEVEDLTRRSILYFEGVYQDVTVSVNGAEVGRWTYGYSSFYVDVTGQVQEGVNRLEVRVVHQAPNSRWYSGAGIFRPVHLLSLDPIHFAVDGVRVHSEVDLEGPYAELRVYPDVSSDQADALELRVWDDEGALVAETSVEVAGWECVERVDHQANLEVTGTRYTLPDAVRLTIASPRLWSPETPELYQVELLLLDRGAVRDRFTTHYGFRHCLLDPDEGFLLNGQKRTLHGVCQHHDLGLLGAAYHPDAQTRILKRLQSMGVDAIRTAHNMPAPDLMDQCDRLGLIVISEAFDMWRHPKTPYDYARFFDAWVARDVASWVMRDRNHPSVVMWSLGNEIADTHAGPEGRETMHQLMDLVRTHDPDAHAVPTLGSNYMAWPNTQACADDLKVIGYNYAERLYDEHHAHHPDWVIYGSETSSVVQSRGVYHFPRHQSILSDDDGQCSDLGNSAVSWGAPSRAYLFEKEAVTPYSLGQFIWTGTDYIGEPTPYHSKSSFFGQIDTAGFPKDAFYHFKAAWTDPAEETVLHLFPHWDHSPGQQVDVVAVSNGASVELFLNGESQGAEALSPTAGHVEACWSLTYQPGEIRVVTYDAHGQILTEATRRTPGDPAALTMDLTQEGKLLFAEIACVDEQQQPVDQANARVRVTVTGPASLIGMDNGDSTDNEPYRGAERKLFSGRVLAMLQITGEGEVSVEARSEGLTPAVVQRLVTNQVGSEIRPTVEADRTQPATIGPAIPIRKLELHADRLEPITEPDTSVTITAVARPSAAPSQPITWRVTDTKGVDSPIAQLEVSADTYSATLRAQGDGELVVRASVTNGKPHPDLIASLTFTAEGLGAARITPYEEVSATFYTDHEGVITAGNERGIAMDRGERSWVAYRHLDWGSYGSDRLTMPVFSFSNRTRFKLWRGLPDHQDSTLLYDDVVDVPTIWNTYQTYHFQLSERLSGQDIFAIELEDKAHIRGFTFERVEKGFARLTGQDRDRIYGDQYEEEGSAIRRIGNNVSIQYRGLDWGEEGSRTLIVEGSTELPRQAIHLIFQQGDREERELIEFDHAPTTRAQTFALTPRTGAWDVTVMFLPGSAFDLEALQFS